MLSILGLSAAEELTYRRLVGGNGLDVTKLAADTGQDVAVVQECVLALTARGLVVPGDVAGEVTAAPPAVALGALLRERHDDLRAAEFELTALVDEYRARATDRASGDLVEVITDVDAVRHRFAQLQQSARHDVRSMVVAGLRVVPAAQNAAGMDCLQRGVRSRAIVDRAVLAEPGGAAAVSKAVAEGQEIRVIDRVPVKLMIADDTAAMLPLLSGRNTAPESVLIRASGLLDALIAYFDDAWSRAYPITHLGASAAAAAGDRLDEADRQLLAMLLSGLTDQAVASQLGTSLRSVQRRIAALMMAAGATTRIQLGWHAAHNGWA